MWSVAVRNSVLNSFLAATHYLALNTADPGITGDFELAGGSYVRLPITTGQWGAAASAQSAAAIAFTWTDLPACTITHLSLWTALSAGAFEIGGELPAPEVIAAGEGFIIPASALLAMLEAGSI